MRACIAVPALCGLWSLWLGVDTNEDLFNYHLYNPFAFLHGKLAIDFAPAGLQSYFNPLLDLFYYGLHRFLPAPAAGFVMGVVHGLNFVLLLVVARAALADLPEPDRGRVPLWLAIAGCLTANFLSGLGNSMGDDTTALFVLGSLALVLSLWTKLGSASWRALGLAALAGVPVGAAAGLKLTNAVYAVALCIAFVALPGGWWVRARAAFACGLGILAGLTATGGFWFLRMWHLFGNPVYPQFSTIFPHPYVAAVGVVDTQWPPKTLADALLWPFVLTLNSHRGGQMTIHQVIWPVLYVLLAGWAVAALTRHARGQRDWGQPPLDGRAWFVLAFVAAGFVVWMKVFSIYRYIVPIELCAPLAVFIVFTRLFRYPMARRAAAWTLSIATAVVVCGGAKTYGHVRWAQPAYRADVPALAQPAATSVVIVGDFIWGWLAPFFPPDVAFIGLSGNFPQTPAYNARAEQIIANRGGPAYAIVEGHYNRQIDRVAQIAAIAHALGLTDTHRGCALLRWASTRLHLQASVTAPASVPRAGALCALGLLPKDDIDVAAQDRASVAETSHLLGQYGFTLDPGDCVTYRAYAGVAPRPYQWCRMSPHPR